jgi:hypothetical protein
MDSRAGDPSDIQDLAKKPNRALIVQTIGSRDGASFTDLKSELGIGVGTLYYHLDGLSRYVTQNAEKQYVLTAEGVKAYEYLKSSAPLAKRAARRPFRLFGLLREVLFFESYVENLGTDPLSNAGPAVGIVVLLCLLSSTLRVEPTMLILRLDAVLPQAGVEASLLSWFIVLAVMVSSVATLRVHVNLGALVGAAAFAFIPMLVLLTVNGFMKTFKITALSSLFSVQAYPLMEIVFAVWAAYILTIGLRASARLSFERSLVITLTMLLINVGYLWLLPVLKL